ncbi:hypothetical protein ACNJUT_21180, partial [Mycobacterium tuberculosis]
MTVHPASRPLLIAMAASAVFAGVAAAQDAPVSRSFDHGAPPETPPAAAPVEAKPATAPAPSGADASDPTRAQIAAWLKADADPVQAQDARDQILDGPGPRQIHGEVSATISNRGYGGYAAVYMPLGEASELD